MGQSALSKTKLSKSAKPSAIQRSRRFLLLALVVYGLYLVKSANGINISDRYTAPWWVKLPIASIMEARYGDHSHS